MEKIQVPRMLLPSVLTKLKVQHRALSCYLLLSIWLFLLIGGMYKYIGTGDVIKLSNNDVTYHSFSHNIHPSVKTKNKFRICNSPQDISESITAEGLVNSNFTLEAVFVLIRHGDRGPLTHVRNISNINCGSMHDPFFETYKDFVQNISGSPLLFQLLGPFHGFPLIPSSTCNLGQLTQVGISQLLTTGRLLKKVYSKRLGLTNLTTQQDFVVYSTKYRRTLQSGLAFLYSFLSPDLLHNVVFRESQSLQFCFDDCACPSIETYVKKIVSKTSSHLKSHPAVLKLVNIASLIIYEMYEKNLASDPYSLRDALLTYVCHEAKLPCSEHDVCVRKEHITTLFAYIEWETRQNNKSPYYKYSCLLRSYGLIKNIVSHLVRIISEKRPKFVLYSGHDKTIQYLTTALGVATDLTITPLYASRLIFEVYRSSNQISNGKNMQIGSDFYFRLVFNGKDITNRIHFCRRRSILDVSPLKAHLIYLCPIESIIRFLHDDYFTTLNSTNLKDACVLH
uniref:2-phosphoxylose phosphatase 1 n=1 Tax=Clastoptera arizonana TaxID=38151 RepID=A0A1B6EF73_9HEMI